MQALIIGGGPAGLMAAEALCTQGFKPVVVDAKPSLGRKFLMAGKSGLNLSKSEPHETFISHFDHSELHPMLTVFGPDQVIAWAEGLGQPCFTGSSGRVFPKAMKASPLLRSWLQRLTQTGCSFRTKWRWQGWEGDAYVFDTPEGKQILHPKICVLAMGGASWSRLGSDGLWASILAQRGIHISRFAPANVGLTVPWSQHMQRYFGAPLKNVVLSAGKLKQRGEIVISERGLEGGGLYPLTPPLRQGAELVLDLAPDVSEAALTDRLSRPRGKASIGNVLRKTVKLSPQAQALLMECARPLPSAPASLAKKIKSLTVPDIGLRPMDEGISTAGGVSFASLTPELMTQTVPGLFIAGEMLDWEAPTGGYLLTGCLATGLWAGRNAGAYLKD